MDARFNKSDFQVISDSFDDSRAFAMIFDRHFKSVYRFVVARCGVNAAEDVTSEIFITAFEKRSSFKRVPSARPWLLGIANNVVARHLDKHYASIDVLRQYLSGESGELPDPLASIEQRESDSELKQEVASAIGRLNHGDRDALLLFCWEGLSYEEVAATLKIPIGTVRSRISRARRQVGDSISKRDFEGTTVRATSARRGPS
jgi:RNA polymerase sigma factor (sigma-70 family)